MRIWQHRRDHAPSLRQRGLKCTKWHWLPPVTAQIRFTIHNMTTLARLRVGRILLHLLAMLGDRCVRFHVAGMLRELPLVAAALSLFTRMRTRFIGALAIYLAQPIKSYIHNSQGTTADPLLLGAILDCGDVLLSDSNTRVAALVRRFTRSPWSHVSMYVGPLEEGADPLCIVEADIAAGVRSIRLSELNALHVRVLRPINLNDKHKRELADWVVSRIGSEYDLGHAWRLGRRLLRLRLPKRLWSSPDTKANGATRFICCSLLAHAFTLVGYPISPVHMRVTPTAAIDHRNLTPADFERVSGFEVVRTMNSVF
jgi:hypothetical protein